MKLEKIFKQESCISPSTAKTKMAMFQERGFGDTNIEQPATNLGLSLICQQNLEYNNKGFGAVGIIPAEQVFSWQYFTVSGVSTNTNAYSSINPLIWWKCNASDLPC